MCYNIREGGIQMNIRDKITQDWVQSFYNPNIYYSLDDIYQQNELVTNEVELIKYMRYINESTRCIILNPNLTKPRVWVIVAQYYEQYECDDHAVVGIYKDIEGALDNLPPVLYRDPWYYDTCEIHEMEVA